MENINFDLFKNDPRITPELWAEAKKAIETLTNKYMSREGMCKTVLGEMMRAVNQILYRFYNDGDHAGEGYGRDTVAPAALYLFDLVTNSRIPIPDGDDEDFRYCMDGVGELASLLLEESSDKSYEVSIKALAIAVLDLIGQNFKYFANARNTIDMYKYKIVDSWSGRLVSGGIGRTTLKRMEELYDVYLYDDEEDEEEY